MPGNQKMGINAAAGLDLRLGQPWPFPLKMLNL
jgi:hypothetical protein